MDDQIQTLIESKPYIQSNWLTQKPNPNSQFVVIYTTFIMFFVSFSYWNHWLKFNQLMSATHQLLFTQGELWRAWSTLFVHGDLGHLLSNSLLFIILGYFLNSYFGFLVFPLMAILSGGLINFIVLSKSPPEMELIGMSGVVFWMGAVWLTLYSLLETRKTTYQRIIRALGVAILLFVPSEAFDPHISYQSHFIGFVLGLLFGIAFFLIKRKMFKTFEVIATEE